jgi:hypothetical protein
MLNQKQTQNPEERSKGKIKRGLVGCHPSARFYDWAVHIE